jgi:hypothetical protein
MDQLERAQIRLLLEHLGSEYHRLCSDAQNAMQADHSAKGLLQSGATVEAAIRIAEEHTDAFVDKLIDEVAAVAQDIDAFNLIVAALTPQFRGREAELAEAVRLATAGEGERFASVQREGDRLFAEMRSRVFKRLEIHRFSFTRPTKGDLEAMRSTISPLAQRPASLAKPKNAGGVPLAQHWDAMWADIAVKLWLGELDPKTQADVKRAMFDWFNGREIAIGDTAVTQRARQLWQKIQESR